MPPRPDGMPEVPEKYKPYLLDEPIAGLDPKFKQDLIKAFRSNINENAALIISSHLLRDLDPIMDYIAIMKKNEIITATSDDIRAQGKSIEDFYLEVIG
jgi:ABC-2 type transport system ATP-binding protein